MKLFLHSMRHIAVMMLFFIVALSAFQARCADLPQAGASTNIHAAFQQAGLGHLLNQDIRGKAGDVAKARSEKYAQWFFLFRPDGTVSINGIAGGLGAPDWYFCVKGQFEIQQATAGSLKMRVFGYLEKQEYGNAGMKKSDFTAGCSNCLHNCTIAEAAFLKYFRKFEETLSITQQDGKWIIQNLSVKNLAFDRLPIEVLPAL